MATRAEQQRASSERASSAARPKRARKPKSSPRKSAKDRTAQKATFAIEPRPRTGRPSRKSSRAGANRKKADTNFNLREEMTKGSPESRARRARAASSRVRGRGR